MRAKTAIKRSKYVAENADLSGSRFCTFNLRNCQFHNVNLSKADFNDVNLSIAKFHNINLSYVKISAAQMGGAKFKHIGLPRGSKGKQRPLKFEECDLNGTVISKCDLSNVKIRHCNVEGMTIDGILVTDLMASYKQV